MKLLLKFPCIRQLYTMQCGAACLTIICRYYGLKYPLQYIDKLCDTHSQGVSLKALQSTAEELGFDTMSVKINLKKLLQVDLPAIIHWKQSHFVVLYKISSNQKHFYISDPARGNIRLSKNDFISGWCANGESESDAESMGIVLMLEETPQASRLYSTYSHKIKTTTRNSILDLCKSFSKYKNYTLQLIAGLILSSLFQLVFPFLTQAIVDYGIFGKNINIIFLILLGECVIVFARTFTDFIRRWLLLHISMRVNITLISNFIEKLFKLPMKFFDTRHLGDFYQRIEDNHRIQSFLTSQTLSITFALISLVVFTIVLGIYNAGLLAVYMMFSAVYAIWICIFLQKRKSLDYETFSALAANQSCTYQLLSSMQETKVQRCETKRRWEWEDAQSNLFDVQIKNLKLQQVQESGSICINELKNIVITVLAASAVINGEISLGAMLAIQFIIGQLNSPISQVINFIYSLQDLRISYDRVNEIHNMEEEEIQNPINISGNQFHISFKNVSFKYDRFSPNPTLENIDLSFNSGKVTAIVGASGSGKSTIIKLLLGYYQPQKGEILINGVNLNSISLSKWRESCGTVLQEGIIYSDTIAGNIVMTEDPVNDDLLNQSLKIAGIYDYVYSLPLKIHTKIGPNGKGLSLGQKQRILIARAIYRDPDILIFDEATNSLDTINENCIVNNLKSLYKNKATIIIAHRLSTVKDADEILVMESGKIVERGTYTDLINQRNVFYQLVKNQIDLSATSTANANSSHEAL